MARRNYIICFAMSCAILPYQLLYKRPERGILFYNINVHNVFAISMKTELLVTTLLRNVYTWGHSVNEHVIYYMRACISHIIFIASVSKECLMGRCYCAFHQQGVFVD